MNESEVHIPERFAHDPEFAKQAIAAGVDLQLLDENLQLTPEMRLNRMLELLETIEALHQARKVE